ncbi:hypothetical protein LMG28690_04677 [Paraburkholderia caffeinilytica]|nr:hypothetical protein LMG28690_04677 [Paraburkholderia caffeinilytica]
MSRSPWSYFQDDRSLDFSRSASHTVVTRPQDVIAFRQKSEENANFVVGVFSFVFQKVCLIRRTVHLLIGFLNTADVPIVCIARHEAGTRIRFLGQLKSVCTATESIASSRRHDTAIDALYHQILKNAIWLPELFQRSSLESRTNPLTSYLSGFRETVDSASMCSCTASTRSGYYVPPIAFLRDSGTDIHGIAGRFPRNRSIGTGVDSVTCGSNIFRSSR